MSDIDKLIRGGDGSHWEGCEDAHWDCRIAKLEAENKLLRDAILTLTSSIDYYASSLGPVRTYQEFDAMMNERDEAEALALRTASRYTGGQVT